MRLATLQRLFARRPPGADPSEFAEALRRAAVFTTQKTVIDYCRVKAAGHEQALFADPDFQAALAECRWRVFLAAADDVAAMAESWLRPHAADPAALADRLAALAGAAIRAEDPPESFVAAADAAEAGIAARLRQAQLAPPRPINEMRLAAAPVLLDSLPIHPDRRRGEDPAILGALRFHLVSAQDEFVRRFDPAALARALA